MHTCLFHIHLYFYLPPSCHLFFSSLSSPAHQHNESSVCVCVPRVSRAAAQRHTIFTAPAPFAYFDTWGLVSRAAQRQQRQRRTFCFTLTHTHTMLFVWRALAESSSLLSLSYSLDRWHANAANAICKKRVPLIRRPLSVSPPPFLSRHPLPRLTSSLFRCSASLSATVTHLLCFNNSHIFMCFGVCVSP